MRVLVAGAGPAGSMTARVLAREGVDVTLADKARFPRDKACGDVVGPRAAGVLAEEGLAPPSPGRPIGAMVMALNGREMGLPAAPGLSHPGVGWSIPRLDFDAWLRQEAVASGATPVQAAVRSLGRARGGFLADLGRGAEVFDVVVGADGANSTVARAFGLVDEGQVLRGFAWRRYVAGDLQADRIDLIARTGSPPGYGWAFGVREGLLNVGVGIAVGSDRRRVQGLGGLLDEYVERLCARGIIRAAGHDASRELGGWLRMGIGGTRVADAGCYLVGDAAGLTNPLQGEGIAAALISGRLAARAILAHGADGGAFYREGIEAEFGAAARAGYVAQGLALRYPRVAAGALEALVAIGAHVPRVAAGWGIFSNELVGTQGPSPGAGIARVLLGLGDRTARSLPRVRAAFVDVL